MKKYLSYIFAAAAVLSFAACSDDDDQEVSYGKLNLAGEGAYVINEGNYSGKVNGTIDWISTSGDSVVNGVFASANGFSAGGTLNDGLIDDDILYVTATDENLVWMVNANTAEVVGKVTVYQPRCLVESDDNVYVTSYNGRVYEISEKQRKLTDSTEVIGDLLEGIAERNGYLYVCNSCDAAYSPHTNVIKLKRDGLEKVKDITVGSNPNIIVNTSDGIYVNTWGNYSDESSDVQQIDDDDQVTSLGIQASVMAVGNGKLYLANTDYSSFEMTYLTYDLTTKETAQFIEAPMNGLPYQIAVDSETGDVLVGLTNWTNPGFVFRYSSDGELLHEYGVGLNPGTIVVR